MTVGLTQEAQHGCLGLHPLKPGAPVPVGGILQLVPAVLRNF